MSYDILTDMHDAELIVVDASKAPTNLILQVRTPVGMVTTMTLWNCNTFRLVDFRLQNVISQLLICSGTDCDDEMITGQLQWLTSMSDADSYLTESRIEEIREEIRNMKYSLMVIIPSAGAEFAALYESMTREKQ